MNRRFVIALMTVLVSLSVITAPLQAAEELDQQQATSLGPANHASHQAQTFQAGKSGYLTKVRMRLSHAATYAGYNFTVEIRAVDNAGAPTGTAVPGSGTTLASVTLPESSIGNVPNWYDINFSSPAEISSGTSYAIVLIRTKHPTSGMLLAWLTGVVQAPSDLYPAGKAWFLAETATSWSTGSSFYNYDQPFETYVTPMVTNRAPVANAGSDVSGAEGSSITLDGSASDLDGDNLTYAWSYEAGTGVDAGATCSFADPAAVDTSISCTDDGTYTVTLTVSDGAASASDTAVVTVSNAAPVVGSMSGPVDRVGVYISVSVSAPFSDAGSNDTHTATIDWGDGTALDTVVSVDQSLDTATGNHSYATPGNYTVTLTVTDDDGASGQSTYNIEVYNPGIEEDLDQQSAGPAATPLLWEVSNTKTRAQTFTAGKSGALTSVDTYIARGSTADLTMEIYAVDSVTGFPTGSALASVTVSGASLPFSDWHRFTFTSPASIESGTQYAIVLKTTGYHLWGQANGDYGGGVALDGTIVYPNTELTWSDGGWFGRDFAFKTFVTDPANAIVDLQADIEGLVASGDLTAAQADDLTAILDETLTMLANEEDGAVDAADKLLDFIDKVYDLVEDGNLTEEGTISAEGQALLDFANGMIALLIG